MVQSPAISRLLIGIIVLAVIVRLGTLGWMLAWGGGEDMLVQDDAVGYMELATNLANGSGFVATNPVTGEFGPERFRSIGMPLLLAPFTFLPHPAVAWGIFLAVVAGIFLPLLTYGIGRRMFGDAPALIAATLVAFEPHMVWFSWLPLTEIPFLLCFLAGCWLMLRSETSSGKMMVLAGLLFGYAALIRPPFLFVFGVLALGSLLWCVWYRIDIVRYVGAIVLGFFLILAPWSIRNAIEHGTISLSGMGWYNVYADYLASVRSIENQTLFTDEKAVLRSNPPEGILASDLMDPASAPVLRDFALAELWERRMSVVRLETALLLSFFTNDGYFYYMEEFGFLPRATEKGLEHSVTFAALSGGSEVFSRIAHELQRQYYIPLFGRALMLGILLAALLGVVVHRNRWTILLAGVIGLTAVVATAVGLGVQARLRLPVQPLLFLFAGAGIWYVLSSRSVAAIARFVGDNGRELARFVLSGVTAATVGGVTLFVLTDGFGVWYLAASIVSFCLATATAFSLQKFWTFREHSMQRMPLQSMQTMSLALLNLALNTALMYVLVEQAGAHYLVSQCIVYLMIGAIDFFVYKLVIFRHG